MINDLFNSNFYIYKPQYQTIEYGNTTLAYNLCSQKLPCYITYLAGQKTVFNGKENVIATHRLFCDPVEITTIDRIYIVENDTWYNVLYIDNCDRLYHHYELLLESINGPQVISLATSGTSWIPTVLDTAKWDSVWTTVNTNSAMWALTGSSCNLGDIPLLSANWNDSYTNLVLNSAIYLLSGTNINLGDIPLLSANWNDSYTNLVLNSAAYLTSVNLGDIPLLSANWNDSYTNLVLNSAAYLTSVNLGDIPLLSANWNDSYTNLVLNSASYLSGQNLNQVLSIGNDAGGTSITNIGTAFFDTIQVTGNGAGIYGKINFNAGYIQDNNFGVLSFYNFDNVTPYSIKLGTVNCNSIIKVSEITPASGCIIKPAADSTTAINITKNDGVTNVVTVDTQNKSLLVNGGSAEIVYNFGTRIHDTVIKTSTSGYNLALQSSLPGVSPIIHMNRDRAGSIVQNTDALGTIRFAGWDGTSYIRAGDITVAVSGTPGAADMPGKMSFSVTPDGGVTPVLAMYISPPGDVWMVGNCSALTYTDRTPYYDGDAIKDISNITGKVNSTTGITEIDHKSLPKFAQKGEERNIGAMVSILTEAIKQLTDRVKKLETG